MFVRHRRASAGMPTDNGRAPEQNGASQPSRTQLSRRIRYLRQLRELQLRDIGGFLVESHRFGRARDDLVQAKLQEAAVTDQELRSLERALGENKSLEEIRRSGIGGSCSECGNVFGSGDRFCAWCGQKL